MDKSEQSPHYGDNPICSRPLRRKRIRIQSKGREQSCFSEPSQPSKKIVAKLPYDTPEAPKQLKVTGTNKGEVSLAWSEPINDGGSKVKNYIVEMKEPFASRWSPVTKTSDTEVTVDGLRIDTEYTFRVRAENKAGPGKPSNEVEAVAKPPFDIPDAPSKPEVSDVTENSATLNWSPPFSDGGSPIIGYTVEKKDKFGTRWTPVNKTPIEETTFVVSGLKEGEECQFRVIAENKAGHSEPSAATRAVRIKAQYDQTAWKTLSGLHRQ
ncbi:putative titin-like [Apostichopus japonicus]|uniref:Putative titin-like n=1 Tax=Stichopus japonicus TaxID=307972 RepID=A0A2G8LL16_STIJA|nr:putative titin-like [Apostichopus japonicus]